MESVRNVELVLGLLALATVLRAMSDRIGVPYPITLALGGFALGLWSTGPTVVIAPELILLLFVPPLLYYGGVFSALREIRASIRPILVMALGLVFLNTAVVAAVAHFAIPGFDWPTALVVGAIVSSVDSVAIIALARRLHLPRRLATILEGEGLLGAASSLTLYQLGVATVLTGLLPLPQVATRFVVLAVGGILIGLFVGWSAARIRQRFADPDAEVVVSVLTPFVAWIAAEAASVSPILAVATAGIYIGRWRLANIEPSTRVRVIAFWSVLVVLLENLLFILMGLQLRPVLGDLAAFPVALLAQYVALVCTTLIFMRVIWIVLVRSAIATISRHAGGIMLSLSRPEGAILAWMGVRGAETLAPAFALPFVTPLGATFPNRSLIIFLTLAVVFVTLVVQGLILPPLVRRLRIPLREAVLAPEERLARINMTRAAIARLAELVHRADAPREAVQEVKLHLEHQLSDLHESVSKAHRAQDRAARRLQRDVIAVEREAIVYLRDRGIIDDAVLNRIQQELDTEEELLALHSDVR